jgi:catechol 2,3-dioxygenase-like lactoylglutathione lyase family enzyme
MTDRQPIRIREIDHVVLRVSDMARMRRFYCDVLGCGVEEELPELDMVQLRAGSALIDLVDVAGELGRLGGAAPGKEGRNMDHFCVRVEPFDADAILRHLRAHGVEPGEVVQRSGAEGTGPSIYLDDPEGNMVELKGPSTA